MTSSTDIIASLFGSRLILVVCAGLALSSCSPGGKPEGTSAAKLPLGGVNTPSSQQLIKGKVGVTGWALSEDGIESVSVYVDRTYVVAGATGLSRPDVAGTYPSIKGSDVSGWRLTLDTSTLSPDWHELTVQVRSKAGATRDIASMPLLVQR